MREMKCPICGEALDRKLLRSETFLCPTCKEPLRGREFSPLLAIPVAACAYSLTFVIAQRMGLKGYGLLITTIFLGCPASFLAAVAISGVLGWMFCLPPPLERAPRPTFDDGGTLHIDSPPEPRKVPK